MQGYRFCIVFSSVPDRGWFCMTNSVIAQYSQSANLLWHELLTQDFFFKSSYMLYTPHTDESRTSVRISELYRQLWILDTFGYQNFFQKIVALLLSSRNSYKCMLYTWYSCTSSNKMTQEIQLMTALKPNLKNKR